MSHDFSRRQSLKMMAGAGLLSALPLATISASELKHAYIVSGQISAADVFSKAVSSSIEANSLSLNLNNYSSFLSIADLPQGSLVLGLVNEAEKVLLDAIVQDKRGIIKTTARVSADIPNGLIPNLAEVTLNSALEFTNDSNVEEIQHSELSSGSLMSFYAYL